MLHRLSNAVFQFLSIVVTICLFVFMLLVTRVHSLSANDIDFTQEGAFQQKVKGPTALQLIAMRMYMEEHPEEFAELLGHQAPAKAAPPKPREPGDVRDLLDSYKYRDVDYTEDELLQQQFRDQGGDEGITFGKPPISEEEALELEAEARRQLNGQGDDPYDPQNKVKRWIQLQIERDTNWVSTAAQMVGSAVVGKVVSEIYDHVTKDDDKDKTEKEHREKEQREREQKDRDQKDRDQRDHDRDRDRQQKEKQDAADKRSERRGNPAPQPCPAPH